MRDGIIGHTKILDFFDKVMAAGNLSHAYCFVGPSRVGKKTVAESLSASLFGVSRDKLRQQPDFMPIEQGLNQKTGKLKKNIDVEQIRELRNFLVRGSFLGGYKIAIIGEANKLNDDSANVMLKTLEEPRGKSVIFLLATDEDALPKTVSSRCQIVYFHPVAKADMEKFILSRVADSARAREMARLSGGLPGRVMEWLANNDDYEAYKKEVVRFIGLFHQPFFAKLKRVEDLFAAHERAGAAADHIAEREKILRIMDVWLGVLRGFMHTNHHLLDAKLKFNLSDAGILKITGLINDTRDALRKNIHPRLLLEGMLLEIP